MKLYSIKEMKDSRIFFDKQPPKFMSIFVLMIIILLAILVIWTSYATKTYVVKAKGLVTSSYSTNISNEVQGTIVDIMIKEGERVNSGDVILSIDMSSQGVQSDSLIRQKELLERKVNLYNRYEKALNEGKNPFKSSGEELEFYGKMEYYLGQVKSYNNSKTKSNKEINEYNDEIKEYSQEASKNKSLIEQYNKEINEYSNKIKSITTEIKNIQDEINKAKEVVSTDLNLEEKNIEENSSQDKLEEKLIQKQSKKSELENKKNETENKKAQLESEIETLESSKKSAKKNSEYSKEGKTNADIQNDGLKSQLISQLGQERSQLKTQIAEIDGKYLVEKEIQTKFDIKAMSDGIIHFNTPIKKGMTIQAGTQIGSILSENKEDIIIDTFVSSNDRTKINQNDEVNIVVDGLMQTKYGFLEGNVETIETDSTVDNESKAVFFRTKVSSKNTYLKDKSGNKVNLKPGMTTEVRIKYDESTWMEWLLEQINVITR